MSYDKLKAEYKAKHRPSIAIEEDQLGEGGFSVVFAAMDGNVPCVVKFSKEPVSHQAVKKEMAALLSLIKMGGHPRLASLTFICDDLDGGHLATQWEKGDSSLKDLLKLDPHGISRDQLLNYMEEVAEGIDFLREKGIAHRDIKPDNLVLFQGHVKLIDFGFARSFAQGSTCHSTIAQTDEYAPPEARTEGQDIACDIYSLAMTYIHLLTGRLPSSVRSSLLRAGNTENLKEMGLQKIDIDALAIALHSNPDQRTYKTAREFVKALREPLNEREQGTGIKRNAISKPRANRTYYWNPPPGESAHPPDLKGNQNPPCPPMNVKVRPMGAGQGKTSRVMEVDAGGKEKGNNFLVYANHLFELNQEGMPEKPQGFEGTLVTSSKGNEMPLGPCKVCVWNPGSEANVNPHSNRGQPTMQPGTKVQLHDGKNAVGVNTCRVHLLGDTRLFWVYTRHLIASGEERRCYPAWFNEFPKGRQFGRTQNAKNSPDFHQRARAISQVISQLAPQEFTPESHEGSWSWEEYDTTVLKLCFYGDSRPWLFGVRAASIPCAPADPMWTHLVEINEVKFVSFDVKANPNWQADVIRAVKLLIAARGSGFQD